ncbi:uncharacterized protein TM35_000014530 [Trypanosoma theileri]|uniref:Uncharacterized protein n=1 Tax=Trypanosoma theileri TaxID=67003 RepID=A0A1X0P9I7_9TRYP|nr:uncharacterized protein TM35_000014530 [Trypanosoma theileri]ORC93576.1 hypothetical protein TM35_000014530 [Trypanosoma theileri]
MNTLQPPSREAGWMSTLPERIDEKYNPRPFTSVPFDLFTHQENKPTRNSSTIAQHDKEKNTFKPTNWDTKNIIGVRPRSTVKSDESEEQRKMLTLYMHSYRSLSLTCKERAAQLEKVDAERKLQLKEMADFSEDICAKLDKVQALEREIDSALAEEMETNKWLKEKAKQIGLL